MEVNVQPVLEVHDEVREQELLQQAQERKARALDIRIRQEKMLKQLKEEKEAKQKQKEDIELRKDKIKEMARQKVLEQFESIKNQQQKDQDPT